MKTDLRCDYRLFIGKDWWTYMVICMKSARYKNTKLEKSGHLYKHIFWIFGPMAQKEMTAKHKDGSTNAKYEQFGGSTFFGYLGSVMAHERLFLPRYLGEYLLRCSPCFHTYFLGVVLWTFSLGMIECLVLDDQKMFGSILPRKLTCPLKINGWKMYFLLK